jgi:UDP-N-acetylmuramoylalanine--D-glutamate ligase
VLETSSFQLELTKTFTPKIAVFTNMTMSHAERYDDFATYFRAKMHLVHNGPDLPTHVIVPKKQHELFYEHLESTAKIVHYFDTKDLDLFDFSKVKVLGTHNYENFAATYHVLKAAGVDLCDVVMQKLIDQFSGIPHRLERIASWNEVYFFNDSKSTNIEATKTALSSFSKYLPHHPIVLILGGKLRSQDVSFLTQLQQFEKIALVLAFGEARNLIQAELKNKIKVESFANLELLMKFIQKHLSADENQKLILLFSPCFPSFDQFKNFEHRGEVFKQQVKALISELPSGY